MVYLIPAGQCNHNTFNGRKICRGGFPAPNGVMGGSMCECKCHEKPGNLNKHK